MTITQLEYIVAVAEYRHFGMAAEKCCVTQPTLSMQIQKLEDELGVKIFDRRVKPIAITETGAEVVARARSILREASGIRQLIHDRQNSLYGEVRIGIIPTLAPYLLPPLFKKLRSAYPQLELIIRETVTDEIIRELKSNKLDCGLAATPLNDPVISEEVLFYEEMYVYVSKKNSLYNKSYILPAEINPDQLWLLEEGHCFRTQILNLCELQRSTTAHCKYETGNIESLKRMVDQSDGITILPELAVQEFSPAELKQVKRLRQPVPVREVSLITHRDQIKTRLMQALKQAVLSIVPSHMQKLQNRKVVDLII
jgi:LysR family hydrogen peroxide-inducible transcriptional activator